MGTRRRGREAALKALYSIDLNPAAAEGIFSDLSGWELPADSRVFALELIRGTIGRLDEIDRFIRKASLKWELTRMAAVDRNVLRLAVSEMTGGSDAPVPVIIDEAIELAKKFGGEESGTFVNGILDRIRLDQESVDG